MTLSDTHTHTLIIINISRAFMHVCKYGVHAIRVSIFSQILIMHVYLHSSYVYNMCQCWWYNITLSPNKKDFYITNDIDA